MKKLTFKTFILLMLLSLSVNAFAYGCIWVFLPYADRNHAEQELESKTKQLVSQLRRSKKADGGMLFWNFGRETGADLQLLDESGQHVSFFTFQNIETDVYQKMKAYQEREAYQKMAAYREREAYQTTEAYQEREAYQKMAAYQETDDLIRNISSQGSETYSIENMVQDTEYSKIIKNSVQEARHPFRFIDSEDEYILAIRYNPFRSDEIAKAILSSVPFVAVVTIILSFLSAWIFSYYTTHPIIRINKIAGKIAELDFSWYCPDMRGDEIGMLSKSINKLSDRLHEALDELGLRNTVLEDEIRVEKERERRRMLFFSGISHELKTPIAIVIGQVEGMQAGIGVYKDRDKYLARSVEILQSLNQFIKEVLYVSHIDLDRQMMSSGQIEKVKRLNLSVFLEQLIDEYISYAEFYSVRIEREIEESLFVYGDELLYQKAVANILSNAVTHILENRNADKDGNMGYVAVCLRRIDAKIELSVTNTPAHVADEHLPHLFEAFYRVNDSKEHGSGLGLYITRMIFETFQVDNKIENTSHGVKFTAVFAEAE